MALPRILKDSVPSVSTTSRSSIIDRSECLSPKRQKGAQCINLFSMFLGMYILLRQAVVLLESLTLTVPDTR
jgi:hypothetical protein